MHPLPCAFAPRTRLDIAHAPPPPPPRGPGPLRLSPATHTRYMHTCVMHAQEVLGGREPTANDITKLAYTEACFREALRLHPAVVQLNRDAAVDTTLLGAYVCTLASGERGREEGCGHGLWARAAVGALHEQCSVSCVRLGAVPSPPCCTTWLVAACPHASYPLPTPVRIVCWLFLSAQLDCLEGELIPDWPVL